MMKKESNTKSYRNPLKGWFFFRSCGLLVLFCLALSFRLSAQDVTLKINLRGVYESKITLMPLTGANAMKSLAEGSGIKNNETATIVVPKDKLPGEFVLRFDYKEKESSTPYPAEKRIVISDQNLELRVNPLYSGNTDSTYFQKGEKENALFARFSRENSKQREKVALLQGFLMNYDDTQSKFYQQGIEEFESRRNKYNQWLKEQVVQNKALFVSHTFQFQHVPQLAFKGTEAERLQSMIGHYFDDMDFIDTLMIRTTNLPDWMNGYVNIYGSMSTTEQLRDSLFILAGKRAIEKAKTGHPKVYGWMVDYFYKGYESFAMQKGTEMLRQYIDDPNCLTSKRQEILKRFEGMQKMKKGSAAPSFNAEMIDGMKLLFDGVLKQKKYELVVFYESDCSHCKDLLKELSQWYSVPENKVWFDVITVALDDNRKTWEGNYQKNKFEWHDVWATGGVNSQAATDYYILSTPVIYIIDKEMKVAAMPQTMKEIETFLNN